MGFPESALFLLAFELGNFFTLFAHKLLAPYRIEMLAAFEHLHTNPFYLRNLIEVLLLDTSLDIEEAVERVRYRIAAELGYPETWLALTPVQRAAAFLLANGVDKPFSHSSREAMATVLGENVPSPARVQAALRKLNRLFSMIRSLPLGSRKLRNRSTGRSNIRKSSDIDMGLNPHSVKIGRNPPLSPHCEAWTASQDHAAHGDREDGLEAHGEHRRVH